MPGTLPGFVLTDLVTVAPYVGVGAAGVQWGPGVTYRAHVQERRKVIRMDTGYDATATIRVYLRLGPAVPIGSRITARGVLGSVVAAAVHDGRALPVPSHIDVWCEAVVFTPTTTVTVHRRETIGPSGRVTGAPTVVASMVPAQLVEAAIPRDLPVDVSGVSAERVTIRARSEQPITAGDRVVDDLTDDVYQVVGVVRPHLTVGPSLGPDDIRISAVRVGPTSLPSF